MSPELKVFLLVGAVSGFAYVALYPRLPVKSLRRMMLIDAGLSVLMLLAIGSVYAGSGVVFTLLGLAMPWWLFTLIAAAVVEVPLFLWFCRRNDVDFDG